MGRGGRVAPGGKSRGSPGRRGAQGASRPKPAEARGVQRGSLKRVRFSPERDSDMASARLCNGLPAVPDGIKLNCPMKAQVRFNARAVFQIFEFSFNGWRRNHPDASPAPQREQAHRARRFSGLGPSQVSGHRLERRCLAAAPANKASDRLSPIVERGRRSLKAAAPDWGAARAHNRVQQRAGGPGSGLCGSVRLRKPRGSDTWPPLISSQHTH